MSVSALLPAPPASPVDGLAPSPDPADLVSPPPAAASLPGREPTRIVLPAYDIAAVIALQRALRIGPVTARVLAGRGLADPIAAREFMRPAESHDPGCFAGIERAADLITGHVARGTRIVVHGDYDVDGVCATAIMVGALRRLGADVRAFLPSRTEDGYGVSAATVERLAERGIGLLITVDCGVGAVEEVGLARARGIDVVISDHHAPPADGRLPDCPIVHPALCDYPCPDLCGTGVAYKLAQAIGAPDVESELELVALATVADLMPLHGENRSLVRNGIAAMANTVRPGLRALMAVSRTDPSELDAAALGFRLAPRINAAGRLRRADAGLELLLTADPERAREIAGELDAVNAERRAVEARILWEAEAQVGELGPRRAYVLHGQEWHPGVVGIVASRIAERFHRPAILIAGGSERDRLPAQGSGRSIPGFDLLGALRAVAEHMVRYGGHRAAAGLTVLPDRIPSLRAAFEAHAEEVLSDELLTPSVRVDAIACGSELDLSLAEELAALEPCGMGNPGVRVMVPGARFGDCRAMGEGRHARFSVSSGGARARAVAFGCDGRVPGGVDHPVDAVFSVSRNVWNGAVEAQLVLRHAQPQCPDSIIVLGEDRGYLSLALAELDRPLGSDPEGDAGVGSVLLGGAVEGACGEDGRRMLIDRRTRNPLATLADARCAGGAVLAVCADVPRRLGGLAALTGGFSLVSYASLLDDPRLAGPFAHLVALDPPPDPGSVALLGHDAGFTHLAWGHPELRFVQAMHESRSELRASLGALYRRLRGVPRLVGAELEAALRGEAARPLAAREAGRQVRVLAELGLIEVDRSEPGVAPAGGEKVELEDSSAYRVYSQRHEDGRRFLNRSDLLPAA